MMNRNGFWNLFFLFLCVVTFSFSGCGQSTNPLLAKKSSDQNSISNEVTFRIDSSKSCPNGQVYFCVYEVVPNQQELKITLQVEHDNVTFLKDFDLSYQEIQAGFSLLSSPSCVKNFGSEGRSCQLTLRYSPTLATSNASQMQNPQYYVFSYPYRNNQGELKMLNIPVTFLAKSLKGPHFQFSSEVPISQLQQFAKYDAHYAILTKDHVLKTDLSSSSLVSHVDSFFSQFLSRGKLIFVSEYDATQTSNPLQFNILDGYEPYPLFQVLPKSFVVGQTGVYGLFNSGTTFCNFREGSRPCALNFFPKTHPDVLERRIHFTNISDKNEKVYLFSSEKDFSSYLTSIDPTTGQELAVSEKAILTNNTHYDQVKGLVHGNQVVLFLNTSEGMGTTSVKLLLEDDKLKRIIEEFPAIQFSHRLIGDPIYDESNQLLYFSLENENKLYALSLVNGVIKWSIPFSNSISQPFLTTDHVFPIVVSNDGFVYAVEPRQGKVFFRYFFAPPGSIQLNALALDKSDNMLYIPISRTPNEEQKIVPFVTNWSLNRDLSD